MGVGEGGITMNDTASAIPLPAGRLKPRSGERRRHPCAAPNKIGDLVFFAFRSRSPRSIHRSDKNMPAALGISIPKRCTSIPSRGKSSRRDAPFRLIHNILILTLCTIIFSECFPFRAHAASLNEYFTAAIQPYTFNSSTIAYGRDYQFFVNFELSLDPPEFVDDYRICVGTSDDVLQQISFTATDSKGNIIGSVITSYNYFFLSNKFPVRKNGWYGPQGYLDFGGKGGISAFIRINPILGQTFVGASAATYKATIRIIGANVPAGQSCPKTFAFSPSDSNYFYRDVEFSYVVPVICLATTQDINFPPITPLGDILPLTSATGKINVTCPNGVPYTVNIGESTSAPRGSQKGERFMVSKTDSAKFVGYQIYKGSDYGYVWGSGKDTGSAGGLSRTGTGANDAIPVYARIAANTPSPGLLGEYQDIVIVTVDY
jgi:spore coat protein U-like protein